jgi:hypothetical protein
MAATTASKNGCGTERANKLGGVSMSLASTARTVPSSCMLCCFFSFSVFLYLPVPLCFHLHLAAHAWNTGSTPSRIEAVIVVVFVVCMHHGADQVCILFALVNARSKYYRPPNVLPKKKKTEVCTIRGVAEPRSTLLSLQGDWGLLQLCKGAVPKKNREKRKPRWTRTRDE